MFDKQYAIDMRSTKVSGIMFEKYISNSDTLISLTKKYQIKLSNLYSFSSLSSIIISYAIPTGYIGFKVLSGVLTVADMSALMTSVSTLSNAISSIVNVIPNLYKRVLFYENFRKIYDDIPTIKDSENAIDLLHEPHKIEFCNVSFSYPNCNNLVLKNLSFKIECQEKIALVGLNGAGKTTILKLLMRIYEPLEGDIFIDDINIKDIKLESIYNNFAMVQQNFNLYALSLGENITLDYCREDDIERVQGALNKMNIPSNNLNQQITREFDDEGLEFSGGIKQRVAICRTFFNDSPCVFMDEPSAALDPISEKNLFNILKDNFKDKTQIIISHRLTNAKDYDKIFVLADGKIAVSGSHTELMEFDNEYKDLYQIQLEKYS